MKDYSILKVSTRKFRIFEFQFPENFVSLNLDSPKISHPNVFYQLKSIFGLFYFFGESIAFFEASMHSETWLFRIMESLYDSTKSSCYAMGMLELERTFNFKGWELSNIFSYSDKVTLPWVIIDESYFMTDIIHRRHCTVTFVKMTVSLLGTIPTI